MITFLFTVGLLIFSAITDLKYRKVYNFITFPSMLLGLILAGFPFAGESYYRLLWMVVLLIIGTFRVMGMGDLIQSHRTHFAAFLFYILYQHIALILMLHHIGL